jgi:ABC-2 type transport system permease protein
VTAAVWRQFRLERRMFWRNPSAAFFNFVLPLMFLALFGAVFAGEQENLDVIVPGIAGMSVMSSTFVALAYNMVFLREEGILKRLRGTPLSPATYLGGLAASAVANALIQVAIVIVAGRVLFDVVWPEDWASLAVFLVAGVCCLTLLGVALSHAIPNFDSAGAYINLAFLPMLVISGVFFDDADAPAVLSALAQALPLTHLIDGLSGAWIDGEGLATHWDALVLLLAWTLAAGVIAVRGFSWDARRG